MNSRPICQVPRWTWQAAALVAAQLTLVGLGLTIGLRSCERRSWPPITLIAPVDQSDQTEAILVAYANNLYRTQIDLDRRDTLRVVGFAHDYHPIYCDQPIVGRNAFNERVASRLILDAPATPGTRPELVMEDVAAFIAQAKVDCFVLVQTDGGIEDLSATTVDRINRTIKALAKRPNFRAIAVVGLSERHRTHWERLLAPLGNRAIVRGRNDAPGGLNRLRELMGGGAR